MKASDGIIFQNDSSSYIAIDKFGNFCALTILNVKDGVVGVMDKLSITSPVKVPFGNGLTLVRVDAPFQVVVNEKRLDGAAVAFVQIKVDST